MQQNLKLDMTEPEWLQLMKAERARGKSVSQIARDVGMARPSVSMLLSDTYPAQSLDIVTRKYGAAVVRVYSAQQLCPYLKRGIPVEECRAHASAPMSTSNPDRLRHQRACRLCLLNPTTVQVKT